MKIDLLKPGDVVVHGGRNELERGDGGEKCIVIAIGKYTNAYAPCGRIVLPATGSYIERRVVVAREVKRGEELVWEPRALNARSLMPWAEYKVKNDVIRKQRRAQQQHVAEGNRVKEEVGDAILSALGLWKGQVSVWRHYNRDEAVEVTVNISHTQLKSIIGAKKFRELIKPYRDWLEKPDPSTCQL